MPKPHSTDKGLAAKVIDIGEAGDALGIEDYSCRCNKAVTDANQDP